MFSRFKPNLNPTHAPHIHPFLGILGLLGFLGFLGFVPISYNGEAATYPTFFFFFNFFGCFGFYYKGKMSGTFVDERFKFNAGRASTLAYKAAFAFLFGISVSVISAINGGLLASSHIAISILIAASGLALALVIFLEPYLLYKYENEE